MAELRALLSRLMVALLCAQAAPVSAAEAAAIVTDLRGNARLADGATLELLRELTTGAEIEAGPGTRLVLLHLAARASFELTGPGRFAVQGGGIEARNGGRIAPLKALPASLREVRLQPARIAQASFALRGSNEERGLRLLSPVSTWLLARPPALRWQAPPNAAEDYHVQLTDAENVVLFEARTRATEVELPPHLQFAPGKLFGWQVEMRLADGTSAQAWTEFGLADATLRVRAAAARPATEADSAELIASGLVLESLGLREAARELWALAARQRPQEPKLRALAELP